MQSFGKTLTIPAGHHFVKWDPAGDNFALSCGNTVPTHFSPALPMPRWPRFAPIGAPR